MRMHQLLVEFFFGCGESCSSIEAEGTYFELRFSEVLLRVRWPDFLSFGGGRSHEWIYPHILA